ncbi:MAG TPA: fumarylacetoacetate hydrolase family protein [Saprospiraceae bacterium]|nr:fumarylacetoacetate hydrolase family protein [Saprospiraceae bacterium]
MSIFCVGRNYVLHAQELNNPVPAEPLIFMKPNTALLRDNKDFYFPNFSKEIHYEVELVLKIGKKAKCVAVNKALEFISHYSLGIDFTARDIQEKCKKNGHPWEIAKAFDHSAVLGEMIEISDSRLDDIAFSLAKNKNIVQSGNSKDMLFKPNHIINYISRFFTLQVNDLIFTGTPAGVGPIQIGDQYEGFIGQKSIFSCKIK